MQTKLPEFGFSEFPEACLPYPIFCVARNIRKNFGTSGEENGIIYKDFPQIHRHLDGKEGNFILTWDLGT